MAGGYLTKKRFSMAAVVAVMGLYLAGQSLADDEIKVGIMVPTTGPEAIYGKDMENAVLLAVSEINAKGGILGKNVMTTTSDDACDPQLAAVCRQSTWFLKMLWRLSADIAPRRRRPP